MHLDSRIYQIDSAYRKKYLENDDYLKSLFEGDTDDSELMDILAYRDQICYHSLKRIRRIKERLAKKRD